jgi:hypothetical protein
MWKHKKEARVYRSISSKKIHIPAEYIFYGCKCHLMLKTILTKFTFLSDYKIIIIKTPSKARK